MGSRSSEMKLKHVTRVFLPHMTTSSKKKYMKSRNLILILFFLTEIFPLKGKFHSHSRFLPPKFWEHFWSNPDIFFF